MFWSVVCPLSSSQFIIRRKCARVGFFTVFQVSEDDNDVGCSIMTQYHIITPATICILRLNASDITEKTVGSAQSVLILHLLLSFNNGLASADGSTGTRGGWAVPSVDHWTTCDHWQEPRPVAASPRPGINMTAAQGTLSVVTWHP